MLTAKLIFGVALLALSVVCEFLVRRSRNGTLELASALRNQEVVQHWIDQGLPRCLALQTAARIGAACVGTIGLAVIGLAVSH